MQQWYLYGNEGQQGPYSTEQIKEWLDTGAITPEWSVWAEGMADWAPLNAIPDFSQPASPTTEPEPEAPPAILPVETMVEPDTPVTAHLKTPWWKERRNVIAIGIFVAVILLGGSYYAAQSAGLIGAGYEEPVVADADVEALQKAIAEKKKKEAEPKKLSIEERFPALDPPEPFLGPGEFEARNVVVLVIDGPRMSETWDEPDKKYIQPFMERLVPEGVVFPNFRNEGLTKTVSGHTALITGFYEELENSGLESPGQPSFLQRWLKMHDAPETAAWIVSSKDKIGSLANTSDPEWKDLHTPAADAGQDGGNSRDWFANYRSDAETWEVLKGVIRRDHPQLLVVNLREPDLAGHLDNWEAYLEGITKSHAYAADLWELLQSDPFYKDKTAYFVTNDHGRHLDDVKEGYIQHGDDCEGCRRIMLFAAGPDFEKGKVEEQTYDQIDLPVTIAKILGLEIPESKGELITQLLSK